MEIGGGLKAQLNVFETQTYTVKKPTNDRFCLKEKLADLLGFFNFMSDLSYGTT